MLPDPIELMDARIEELTDEQFGGVADGFIRCFGCGEIVPLDVVEAADARPDAPALCPACIRR